MSEKIWIVLAIGNSRYHWAWFLNNQLQSSWDTAYLATEAVVKNLNNLDVLASCPLELQQKINLAHLVLSDIPIYLVSVVATQTDIWQRLPQVKQLSLADVPLFNLYPTLGIDRAIALLGAGIRYGYPVLVIDGGTALTLTGANENRILVGGAIMPGLRLQFSSLFNQTSALPEVELPLELAARWSKNTRQAIASGILHTISSGLKDFMLDWHRLFPESQVIFTGGDGAILIKYLKPILPEHLIPMIELDQSLLFIGVAAITTHK